jgi:hypothetical protein
MHELPMSVPIVIAGLTIFLTFVVGLTFAIANDFTRTRFIMSGLFVFIVFTLSMSFWQHALSTLPYAMPSFCIGGIIGYLVGVRAAQEKLKLQGIAYYVEHFAHIRHHDLQRMTWWGFINYYSVMAGLLMINLIGISNVLYEGAQGWAIVTSSVGAFLIGTIVPYLFHLWSIPAPQKIY